NWPDAIASDVTVVVYMPGRDYLSTAQRLREAGLSAETPCAIVSRVGSHDERAHVTSIGELPSAPRLSAPSLLVVGEVVRFAQHRSLREQFSQFIARNFEASQSELIKTTESGSQEQAHGPALWSRDPDRCCNLRKVEPLRNKLKELRAWITAIRRDQTVARGSARKLEWDAKFQLVKVNPIADWTSAMVWSYIRRHEVPYNPLHDRNYPSIGCTHCTRATQAGEDARAGRWSGFN